MRFFQAIRNVLWSVFGVRRRADAARDLESLPLGMVVAAGVVVAALVVGAIVFLVRFVIVGAPQDRREPPAATAPAVPQAKRHGPVRVRDTMEERVAACSACHSSTTQPTREGFSPRIAGKPAGYLLNQLVSFRDGRRTNPQMVYFAQNLSDAYLREIAEYFSTVDVRYPPAESSALSPEQAARAERIVRHGDPVRGVPACIACHGKSLMGVAPNIPGVLGLPRQYMNAQFGGWREGKLRSLEPDCMGEVARRLAPGDAPLLTSWLAAQPVAAGMKPEPRSSGKFPLECGSVKPRAEVASLPATQSPGAYLAAAANCVACHTAMGGARFAGGRAIETPFGTVYTTNITPDAATGIGAWSREDFARAMHEGRSKDGRRLYPAFPYPNFTKMDRADVDAIYEYLRGVPAVSRPNTPHALRFPYSMQAALGAWRLLYFRAGRLEPQPARGSEWNRGAYLVQALGHCDACHAERNFFGAPSHSLDLGGGLIPMQKWYAPPLASGKAEEIVSLLKDGISPRAAAMGPMAEVVFRSTSNLTAADARAIASYLQSVPAQPRAQKRSPPAESSVVGRGAVLYGEHCAQCHGDQGEGAFPAYPALAGNPSVTNPVAANAIKAVLHGGFPPSTPGNPRPFGMPAYAERLSEAEIAAVLTYVRASWGNEEGPVSTVDIERYR